MTHTEQHAREVHAGRMAALMAASPALYFLHWVWKRVAR